MTKSILQEWMDDAQRAQVYARESLIVDATEEIWSAMLSQEVTKSELAARLNKSKAYVTQTLNGSRNMTLGTLADIAFALNRSPCFRLHRKQEQGSWKSLRPVIAAKPQMMATDLDSLDSPTEYGDPIRVRRKEAA